MSTRIQKAKLTTAELSAKINQLEVALANMDEADEVEYFVQPGIRPKHQTSFCCEGHEHREMGW